MKITVIQNNSNSRPLYTFFEAISEALYVKIGNKLHAYVEHGDVYPCKSLKSLNSRIWKYKGTIYKLRVDSGKESARVLFCREKSGNLIVIHGFLKSTRKTPAKEAHQAIAIYQDLESIARVDWDQVSRMRTSP